jgi:hypothetical protein
VSTDVTQFGNGDTVSIGSDGLSVYAEETDTLGACTVTADGGSPIRLESFNSFGEELEVATTGPTLQAYASTPDDLPPGSYVISCEGGDSTILATGERIDEDAIMRGLVIGFVIASILGVIGLVLLIVLLVKRHNSKNRIRAEQSAAYYGAWAQQGYTAPDAGHQQQPSYDPYGQQQQQHQGYGSPQGYVPPAADPYGQPQQPVDPYGQPPQPPQPSYDPNAQQPPPSADPYASSQPPANPYGQPSADQPAADPYAQPSESTPSSDSTPEPWSGSDSSDSGSSSDGGSPSDGGSGDSGSSDSNKD